MCICNKKLWDEKEFLRRNIPNTISASRIALSLLLLLIKPLSASFFIIYIACGLSDMLDGYLARKMQVGDSFGAKLDSIADLIFTTVVLVVLIPIVGIPTQIWVVVIIIVLNRIISIVTVYYKYRKFVVGIHTYANKAAGFALYCYPILMGITDSTLVVWIICLVPLYSSIEELIINMTSKKLDVNTKSLFGIRP